MITDGKFVDTNVALDILYFGRKRHKKAVEFYRKFNNMELKLSGKVFTEITDVLTESYALLVGWIRDAIRHAAKSGRDWDSMSVQQRRKFMIEIESKMNGDKNLIKKNRQGFVLEGLQRIQSLVINYSFTDLQDALLELPGDMYDDLHSKLYSYFVPLDMEEDDIPDDNELQLIGDVDNQVVSLYFNPKQDGKDKDIVIEFLVIIAFGAEGTPYSAITFYTEDTNFKANFLRLISYKTSQNGLDDAIDNFLQTTLPAVSVDIAY